MICFKCHKEIILTDKPGFRETCPYCSSDIHICRACEFYDVGSYNDCRETTADRVVDKEKFNFCEYFKVKIGASETNELSAEEIAKKKLEELFKK